MFCVNSVGCDPQLSSPGDHPAPTELKMSHYSISCVLLKWSPAPTTSRPDITAMKCYRVYVNGEVEGMVREVMRSL